ncbi:MAG: DNA internalization-related competence protein ComEC/Rec2 [Planctomycetota bacterium]
MDDIKQKLKLIDKQLTTPADTYRKTITTAPLLTGAIGLITGILLQSLLGLAFWLYPIILITVSLICLHLFFGRKLINTQLFSITAAVAFLCLGAIRLDYYNHQPPNDISTIATDEPALATIRGTIVTDPRISKPKWEFARFKFTDPSTSFYLKTTQIKTINGWADIKGTVRVRVGEPVMDLSAGDNIEAYCITKKNQHNTNPGQFDFHGYLERRNISVNASIKTRNGITLRQNYRNNIFWRLRTSLRNKTARALLSDSDDRDTSLIEALLLGHRQNIDHETYNAFRRTGLLHFISLSGMHLGILAAIIWWLCKIAGLLKTSRAIVCALSVAVFLLIVPPRAPTLRAAIICWLFCLSLVFRRKANPLNTLSLAAIILLLIRPTQLYEAGFQLSFASVLAIMLLSDRIFFFLSDKLNLSRTQPQKRSIIAKTLHTSTQYILRLLAVGIAAWIGGAGLLLYHFYTINPLASVWTVITFPLVALILTFGFMKIILSFLLPTVAALLAHVLAALSELLVEIVKAFSHLQISQINIGRTPLLLILLLYTLVIIIFFINLKRPVIKRIICASVALLLILFLVITRSRTMHRSDLILNVLDVGHGQAILAQLPPNKNILFDAGSLHRTDIGTRTVGPFMAYAAIVRLDAIIISHNDIDHINGIPEIARARKIDTVYANETFFSEAESAPRRLLVRCLRERGHNIQSITDKLNFKSPAKIRTIWPTNEILQKHDFAENDKSSVSLIEFANVNILLCSDIEQPAQRSLLQTYPDLKADIVILPHHGSDATLDPAFTQKLHAKILISSCGPKSYTSKTIQSQKETTRHFSTAKDGAITCRISKEGKIKIQTYATRRRVELLPE